MDIQERRKEKTSLAERKSREARLAVLLRRYALLALGGILYLAIVAWAGFGIPCPFRLATGFLCPGCGVTHLLQALLRGDIAAAWAANPALLLASPLLAGMLLRSDAAWVREGKRPESSGWLTWSLLAYFVAFGIGRNL